MEGESRSVDPAETDRPQESLTVRIGRRPSGSPPMRNLLPGRILDNPIEL